MILTVLALVSPIATQDLQAPSESPTGSWETPRPLEVKRTADGAAFARGELLLGLAPRTDRASLIASIEALGGVVAGEIPNLRVVKVTLPADEDELAAAARYAALAGVRYAEPNLVGRAGGGAVPPNDTFYANMWHLKNTGQIGGTPGADVDIEPAWAIEQGDASVVLAVLDGGIDFAHAEFAGRTLPGYDYVDEDADPTADSSHGLYVTGIAAANADNAFQISGVDRACTILPIKVLDQDLLGNVFDLAQGLDLCAAERADVVNMSLQDFGGTETMIAGLAAARAAGCILISISGNEDIGYADESWPGASPLTISIGATTNKDVRASFSGTGQALDFVAPGQSIVTIEPGTLDSIDFFAGTSAAAPIAAGIVCLLKARHPDLSQECAYELLLAGAEDQVGAPGEDVPGWDPYMGHGRLNAAASLAASIACAPWALLSGSPPVIDVAAGETQTLSLIGSASLHGKGYLMLGSLTGTTPGVPLGGLTLPLVIDPYFNLTAKLSPVLAGGFGVLDAEGEGTVTFQPPQSLAGILAGLTVHHAYVAFDASAGLQLLATSPAVAVVMQ